MGHGKLERNATQPAGQDGSAIILPSLLDLTAAEPLYRSLVAQLGSSAPVVIDAAAVDRVSTGAVQVMVAAALEARARGISFHLKEPSVVFADALADLGFPPDIAL